MERVDIEQMGQLLELMPDPVIVICEAGTVVFANGQVTKLLGYTPDELIGQPLEMIIPERFRAQHAHHSKAYHLRPTVRAIDSKLDLWALCKDGQEVPVDISLGPVPSASGLLIVATIRNASVHKQAEQSLRASLAEVERLKDRLAKENLYLREEVVHARNFDDFVGQSDALTLLLAEIKQVATTDASVLISGETGTGKELVARAIHNHSRRRDRPLVSVNCGALSSSLIESELFGHKAGAFTGAFTERIGRFELAEGGTIFLDEICDLQLDLQTKLLRVLQEEEYQRVGCSETRRMDVRVIAATNRDVAVEIEQGRLRSDLYFRLAVFPIQVPTLSARRADIPLLAWHFVRKKQARLGKNIEQISPITMDRLLAYSWPGNIRELENVIERALILSSGSTLTVKSLVDVVDHRPRVREAKPESVEDLVRDHMLRVLQECHWRIKGADAAADRLGINPSTLRYRMKKFGIRRPD